MTGAGSGIGRACALRQAAEGDHVVTWDLNGDAAQATADQAIAAGGSAESAAVDVADTVAARSIVASVAGRGDLVGLVSAAGVMRMLSFDDLDEAEWDRVLDINLRGTAFLAKSVAQVIRDAGRQGTIVLVSSVAGRRGRPLAAHYAASKAATISLTQSLAMAYGPKVRVNAVCPGVIATPMQDQIARDRAELLGAPERDHYGNVADRLALKRTGEPDDVAKVVQFLLGPLSDYVTGQSINVDGGLEFD